MISIRYFPLPELTTCNMNDMQRAAYMQTKVNFSMNFSKISLRQQNGEFKNFSFAFEVGLHRQLQYDFSSERVLCLHLDL